MKFFRIPFFCLSFVVCCFLLVRENTAQSQYRNTVTGYVFDSQRSPVAQINVELLNEVESVLQRTRTNGSGRFFFSGLSSGRFSIRVLPYGTNLEEQTQEVEIVNIVRPGSSTSENAQKDFYLKPRKNANNAPTINSVVFAQEIPNEARKLYEQAIASFDDKKADAGIVLLQQAIGIFPNYYAALERLGREFINQSKFEDARNSFNRAVIINDRSYLSWFGISYAEYALQKWSAAAEAAKKAFSLNPESVDALIFLGVSQRKLKNYLEAETTLKQAEKVVKSDNAEKASDIHWNLALLYAHNLQRYKDAADQLEKYLLISPNKENAENVKKLIKQFREKSS